MLLASSRISGKTSPIVSASTSDELVEERLVKAERAAVAHGAAEDAAQDVVAVGVAGLDAVGDGEAERADVVGDDAEGDVDLLLLGVAGAAGASGSVRAVFLAAQLFDLVEDRAEDVGFVVGDLRVAKSVKSFVPWMMRGDALEAHAGIDVLGGQRREGAVRVGVELDEDEVPDLDAARRRPC